MDDDQMRLYTGDAYRDAISDQQCHLTAIDGAEGVGFSTPEECARFAHEHNLDVKIFSPMRHGFLFVNEMGETLTSTEWKEMYKDVLFYRDEEGTCKQWTPRSLNACRDAFVYGTDSGNSLRKPMLEVNYFLPTAYRNPVTGCWNIASPFPFFAKDHGIDVSYIFELIDHIAGENNEHLLSWLRRKIMNPTDKTEVLPIFTGRQGTGKTTFGEAICRGVFGDKNVLVTSKFQASARFNSDHIDKLIISIEEKTQDSRFNTEALLKDLATNKKQRREEKGKEPFYQQSYTEYIITTNDSIPLRFTNRDERRFMIMETDKEFTRNKSNLADEIFTQIYGQSATGEKVNEPFWLDRKAVEQFKWELIHKKNLPNCQSFVHTDAYARCFELPRSADVHKIEQTIRASAPFIKQSLIEGKFVEAINQIDTETGETYQLTYGAAGIKKQAMMIVRGRMDLPTRVAICKPAFFSDEKGEPYSVPVVEETILNNTDWLLQEYGLEVLDDHTPPNNGGFRGSVGIYRYAPTLWIKIADKSAPKIEKTIGLNHKIQTMKILPVGKIEHHRFADKTYQYDPNGALETICLLGSSDRREDNVVDNSYFILEGDVRNVTVRHMEDGRILAGERRAENVYAETLAQQLKEAERLMQEGIVQRIVYSGAKSYHLRIKVADAPKTPVERMWLHAHLCKTLSHLVEYDMQVCKPHGLTRAPVTCERKSVHITPINELQTEEVELTGTQKLIAEDNSIVFDIRWRTAYVSWCKRKRSGVENNATHRMLPSLQIYKDAMEALANKTFWTNACWDGQRHQVFFPAYRRARAMGFTHDDVWDVIKIGLEGYAKNTEQWLSKEHSPIIKEIDADYDT